MDKTPYANFVKDRENRNDIHHPHASKHDHYYENGSSINDKDHMQVSFRILFETWVSISYEEAKLTYDNVAIFINTIHGLKDDGA